MSDIGYNASGSFDYGLTYGPKKGVMNGSCMSLDRKIIGLIEDKDKGAREGTKKYLLGQFHSEGLSILKIPPLDRGMIIVAWALQKNNESYKGGWVPLDTSLEALGLSASPNLQSIAKLEINNFPILTEQYFSMMLQDARRDERTVELNLKEENILDIKSKLGL